MSDDDGATFSTEKNKGLTTHLFYTVAGNAEFPNLVIGGLQDNGTRVRTDNGKTYNQVIGGDGTGAAYSQANTNTVIGSFQGAGMRANYSNNPPTTFQGTIPATTGLADFGFPFFTAVVPAPAALDATGRVFFHFSNTRVWRTLNGGLSWQIIGVARTQAGQPPISPGFPADGSRTFRSSPYNLGVSPTDLNRIAVGAAGAFLDITTNGGKTWTDIDLAKRVTGYQNFVTNVTWQDDKTIWITSVAQTPGAVRVIKATIASRRRQLGVRHVRADAARSPRRAGDACLYRSARRRAANGVRRHARRRLPHDQRRSSHGSRSATVCRRFA